MLNKKYINQIEKLKNFRDTFFEIYLKKEMNG
jgi:hypothetical protein